MAKHERTDGAESDRKAHHGAHRKPTFVREDKDASGKVVGWSVGRTPRADNYTRNGDE